MPPRKRSKGHRPLTPASPVHVADESASSSYIRAPILPPIESMTNYPSELTMEPSVVHTPFREPALDAGHYHPASIRGNLDVTQPGMSNANYGPIPPLSQPGQTQRGYPWPSDPNPAYGHAQDFRNQEVHYHPQQTSPSYRPEPPQLFPQALQPQQAQHDYFHGNKRHRDDDEHRRGPPPGRSLDSIADRSYASTSHTSTPQGPATYAQSPASSVGATLASRVPSALDIVPPQSASSLGQSSLSPGTRSKYSLHIRQQPRSARAGPEGRDRRPIDPPVILQLQIMNFDLNNEDHVEDVNNPFWVCHCLLYSADSPRQDVTIVDDGPSRDGSSGVRRLLIGELIASAVLAPEDPDPETAVPHPSSDITATTSHDQSFRRQPGVFFIFSDISVRAPGRYRLMFRLMKMTMSLAEEGQPTPIVANVISEPFTVVNAKGFDKVQESTKLVHGLAKLPNAPATMKIKKGPAAREKAKQRREEEDSDSEGSN